MPFATSRNSERKSSRDSRCSDTFPVDIRSPYVSLSTFGLDGTGYKEHIMAVEERGTTRDHLDNLVSLSNFC